MTFRFRFLSSAAVSALIVAPHFAQAQDYIWSPPGTGAVAPVVGGSGNLDQGMTANFTDPTGASPVTFPGNATIRFTEADPAGNDVVVTNTVVVTGLAFEVSGYNLTSAGGGVLQSAAGGTAPFTISNGSTVTIAAGLDGSFIVQGDGDLTLTGTQDVLDDITVAAGVAITTSTSTGEYDLTNDGTTTNTGVVGQVQNRGGTFVNTADGLIGGDAANSVGTMVLAGRVNGTVTNSDVLNIDEDLVIDGDLNTTVKGVTSIVGGTTAVGGTVGNEGLVVIGIAGTVIGPFENFDGGTADIAGQLDGDFNAASGADTRLTGLINGDVQNAGDFDATNNATINGDVGNTGSLSIFGGETGVEIVTITGRLDNEDGGVTDVGNVTAAIEGGVSNSGAFTIRPTATVEAEFDNLDGGTADIAGTLIGDLTAAGGAETTLTGTIVGDVDNGGQFDASGLATVDGDLSNAGQLTINPEGNFDGGLSMTGTLMNTGEGITDVTSGEAEIAGGVTNSGAFSIAAGANVIADFANQADGNANIDGELTGDLTADEGATTSLTGTITGDISNAGAFDASGDATVAGDVANTGAFTFGGDDLSITGELANAAGGTTTLSGGEAQIAGGVVNGGALTVGDDAQLTADLTTSDGSTTSLSGGITGDISNAGAFNASGDATIAGDFSNTGMFDFDGDDLSITGDLANAAGGTTTFSAGNAQISGSVLNDGAFGIADGAQLTADFTNQGAGTATIGGQLIGDLTTTGASVTGLSGSITGNVNNAGRFNASNGAVVNGDVANTGTISLAENGTTGDALTINGGLSGNGTYALDLDLQGEGSVDRIIVRDGAVTGNIALAFSSTGRPAIATPQRIQVLDIDDSQANDFTVSSAGLPADNSISVYSLIEDEVSTDFFVVGQINPGVGSVAGNFVLTQSLIGAVINRPTSPYVTNLAYDDPDPCGVGLWTRLQNGNADTSTESINGVSQVQSTVNADYIGFQAGGDFACFDNTGSGWDLAFGAVLGFNDGEIVQPVFAIDPVDPTRITDTLTSVTETDFLQSYVSLYGVASNGPWAADLQYRVERTEFDITNDGVGAMSGIGIEEEQVSSRAQTLSGAVSYTYSIPDTDFSLIPTAGFAVTRGTSGSVGFEDGSDLDIGDFESNIGFVGMTAAWSQINADSTGILSQFVTATRYSDFSDDIVSVFTTPDGDSAALGNSTLGSFNEISVGVNYVKVLEIGSFADAKQISASLRGDRRYGGQIDSWGVVGQVRIQF